MKRPKRKQNLDQQRVMFLVRAGEIFHQSLDVNETLDNVARLAVEAFSDLCLFDLVDERSDRLFVTAYAHRDRTRESAMANVSSLLYIEEFGPHPVVEVTRTGKPFFVPHMDETTLAQHAASRQHAHYMREFGYRSKIVVPVTAASHIFGALTFVRTRDDQFFDERDLIFAIELGRRAGLAVANAKQFNRERNVAETLQRAFLPSRLPLRNGLHISAHYRPGSSEAEIGGDWYDAFEIANDQIVITIGDVAGKGIEAARLMVLLRQAIRIAALDTEEPQRMAAVCNRWLLADSGEKLASAFIGVLDPNKHELRYVSAGHAPPFLLRRGCEAVPLESPCEPLGAVAEARFKAHRMDVPDGSMLVLYTDGVLEIEHDVLAGEAMLRRVLSSNALWHAPNPAEFIDRIIANQSSRDDVAIMVVKTGVPELYWQFEAADARAAYSVRNLFFEKIAELCDATVEQLSACALIFAELVANIVRHAPGPLSVSVEISDDDLVLHMIDKGPGFAYAPDLPRDLWSEGGRGLFLIAQLGKHVSVEPIPALGSHIAVTLPVSVKKSVLEATLQNRFASISAR